MSIAFDLIPKTNRVPGAYVEVDPSRALSAQPGELHKVLVIAPKLEAGTAPVEVVVEVPGELSGDPLFGARSIASSMVRFFKRLNPNARVFVMPVADAPGGVAATSTLTLTGTSTEDASLTVRVGDARVTVAVPVGTTAAVAAGLVNTAVGNEPRLPSTSAAAGAVVTFTSVHKGETGNAVTVEAERLPAGITAVATTPTNGATNASIANALAALDDTRYDTVVSAYADAANLALLETELRRRWSPMVREPGHAFAAVRGSHGQHVAAGNARNSEVLTVMGAGLSPTPPWVWAAQTAARDAQQTAALPNRPRNGLTLDDCEAPKPGDRFDTNERNALLFEGISTYKVDPSGKVMIEKLITTYQVNASGVADATYLSIETMRNLAAYYLSLLGLGSRHERDLIAPDGTNVSPGVPVTTPKMMRGEILAHYKQWEFAGAMKDADGFARDLVVELAGASDVERMNAHVLPRLVNGLGTMAFKLSFML